MRKVDFHIIFIGGYGAKYKFLSRPMRNTMNNAAIFLRLLENLQNDWIRDQEIRKTQILYIHHTCICGQNYTYINVSHQICLNKNRSGPQSQPG